MSILERPLGKLSDNELAARPYDSLTHDELFYRMQEGMKKENDRANNVYDKYMEKAGVRDEIMEREYKQYRATEKNNKSWISKLFGL